MPKLMLLEELQDINFLFSGGGSRKTVGFLVFLLNLAKLNWKLGRKAFVFKRRVISLHL